MSDGVGLTGMRRRALDQLLVRYLELERDDQQNFLERSISRYPRLGSWLAMMVNDQHTISILHTSYRAQALKRPKEERIVLEAGHRLGPWRIEAPVGHGGMGMVYKGGRDDGAFQMDVAIKLIGHRRAGLAELLQRECQLLALLDHSSITRLLDAGLDKEAGPFLVMEWVEGTDLEPWLQANRPATSGLLELFGQLVDAVAHAHQRLVVHGDIKPGNVRIREDGVIKLMDFGVSRAMDAEEGEARLRALTPSFAAPEQLEGTHITPQSDQWSLGALLYWMLTGKVIPRQLDTLEVDLRAAGYSRTDELAAIIGRACAPDPGHRYGSVAALGDDIFRFRHHEPLEAQPISGFRRGLKFVRRNPLPVGSVTTTFVALVVGLAFSISMYVDARQAREAATLERDRAEQIAQDLSQVADFQTEQLTALDVQAMGEVIRGDLIEQLMSPLGSDSAQGGLPAEFRHILSQVSFTDIALNTLEQQIFQRTLDAIDEQFDGQPALRARLLQTMVEPSQDVGLLELANQAQSLAIELRREHLGPLHEDTLASLYLAGNLEIVNGDIDAALELLNESLAGRRQVLGDKHPETLKTIYAIGVARHHVRELDGALARYREALAGHMEVLGPDHRETLTSINALGVLHRFRGELDEAFEYQSRALAGFREVLGEDHRETLAALTGIGYLMAARGDFEASLEYFRDSLEGRRRVQGDRHPLTLYSLSDVGMTLLRMGQPKEARPYLEQALARRLETLGAEHPHTIFSIRFMGLLHEAMGEYAQAEPYFRDVLGWRMTRRGEEHETALTSMVELARVLAAQKHHDEAIEWVGRASSAYEVRLGSDHPRTREVREIHDSILEAAGRHDGGDP